MSDDKTQASATSSGLHSKGFRAREGYWGQSNGPSSSLFAYSILPESETIKNQLFQFDTN